MVTNAELQAMYHRFNKKWFGNKLPKDMPVYFSDLRSDGNALGVTRFYFSRPAYIFLNKSLRKWRSNAAMTLLHEMVHVAEPHTVHGPAFHKRMLKLARTGAFREWW